MAKSKRTQALSRRASDARWGWLVCGLLFVAPANSDSQYISYQHCKQDLERWREIQGRLGHEMEHCAILHEYGCDDADIRIRNQRVKSFTAALEPRYQEAKRRVREIEPVCDKLLLAETSNRPLAEGFGRQWGATTAEQISKGLVPTPPSGSVATNRALGLAQQLLGKAMSSTVKSSVRDPLPPDNDLDAAYEKVDRVSQITDRAKARGSSAVSNLVQAQSMSALKAIHGEMLKDLGTAVADIKSFGGEDMSVAKSANPWSRSAAVPSGSTVQETVENPWNAVAQNETSRSTTVVDNPWANASPNSATNLASTIETTVRSNRRRSEGMPAGGTSVASNESTRLSISSARPEELTSGQVVSADNPWSSSAGSVVAMDDANRIASGSKIVADRRCGESMHATGRKATKFVWNDGSLTCYSNTSRSVLNRDAFCCRH